MKEDDDVRSKLVTKATENCEEEVPESNRLTLITHTHDPQTDNLAVDSGRFGMSSLVWVEGNDTGPNGKSWLLLWNRMVTSSLLRISFVLGGSYK